MAFWGHPHADAKRWTDATEFVPPAPSPVPGKGYPIYFVEFDGFVFHAERRCGFAQLKYVENVWAKLT